MPNFNKVYIGGHLGRDPEFKKIGDADLAVFSVATSRKGKDKEYTTWHNVEAWRWAADHCKNLKKGDGVIISGEIKTDEYEKNGEKRYATKIIAYDVAKVDAAKKTAVSENPLDNIPF